MLFLKRQKLFLRVLIYETRVRAEELLRPGPDRGLATGRDAGLAILAHEPRTVVPPPRAVAARGVAQRSTHTSTHGYGGLYMAGLRPLLLVVDLLREEKPRLALPSGLAASCSALGYEPQP